MGPPFLKTKNIKFRLNLVLVLRIRLQVQPVYSSPTDVLIIHFQFVLFVDFLIVLTNNNFDLSDV
jgi:hypothetical protein